MKAAVVVANENVQYQEVEEPQVTPGHVKIKVRYSGICGSDIPRVLNHGYIFIPSCLDMNFLAMCGSGRRRYQGEGRRPCIRCTLLPCHEIVTTARRVISLSASITASSVPESREQTQIM
mgnify:CR=1 FL=1